MTNYSAPKLTHHKSNKMKALYDTILSDYDTISNITNPTVTFSTPQILQGYDFTPPTTFNVDEYLANIQNSKINKSTLPDMALGYTPELPVFGTPDSGFDGTSVFDVASNVVNDTTSSNPRKGVVKGIPTKKIPTKEVPMTTASNVADNSFSLKGLGSKLLGYAKENPGKTLGAATLGAGNLAGLLDNEYWGGQAIGGGLGAAAPLIINKLGGSISPYYSAMLSMGGGLLGSLFDKLRAKTAEGRAMAQPYQGQY